MYEMLSDKHLNRLGDSLIYMKTLERVRRCPLLVTCVTCSSPAVRQISAFTLCSTQRNVDPSHVSHARGTAATGSSVLLKNTSAKPLEDTRFCSDALQRPSLTSAALVMCVSGSNMVDRRDDSKPDLPSAVLVAGL